MKTLRLQIIILLLLCVSVPFCGQDLLPKYQAGAVTELDGKVVFNRKIKTNASSDRLFDLMDKWLNDIYAKQDPLKNRIVLSNSQTKEIAGVGEKVLVFSASALSLDKALMTYQLIVKISDNECDMTFRNIKYKYQEARKDILYTAEEMITDDVALNKDKTKLNRFYNKFRTHTIDSINVFFDSAEIYLNGRPAQHGASVQTSVVESVPTPVVPTTVSQSLVADKEESVLLPGYKRIDADKIPGNIIKLLNDWTLITSGNDIANPMTASWGGLGQLWEQSVAFCFINPTRYSISTMDEGEVYTISFYTEAYKDALKYCGSKSGRNEDKIKGSGLTPLKMPSGATAFSEAWMIIECKKILAQPISADAVIDKNIAKRWSKDGYHKMYVGQILNVWIK